jgi:poly(A) polymerase
MSSEDTCLVIVQFMEDRGLFERPEDTVRRVDILSKLKDVVEHWIKLVAAHRGMSEVDIEDAHAVVNTFGSFRLEVHGPGLISRRP